MIILSPSLAISMISLLELYLQDVVLHDIVEQ